jgi:hypothetical protein
VNLESRHRNRPARLGLQDGAQTSEGSRIPRGIRRGLPPELRICARTVLGIDDRIDLLEALRRRGPCSVYALANEVERNYSNVHTDVGKLEEHGLVKRTPEDTVFVPFESVEIHLALFKRAA